FWLHNNKGRLTRGCNPTSSKFIHTWLRFGEIMRGSLSAKYYHITRQWQERGNNLTVSADLYK
ncbi:YdgH/BhsA/McbA-like domain containing protein, partial [Escherichia coli]|uniref:YdgH/BhsA/McbA-like domain containing protein n=1 Tax=Escherichia coli TaxID=562 RepID=UPI0032B4AC9D